MLGDVLNKVQREREEKLRRKAKFEWKYLTTDFDKLNNVLNELEEKTEWEIFNVFPYKESIVIIVRKPVKEKNEKR